MKWPGRRTLRVLAILISLSVVASLVAFTLLIFQTPIEGWIKAATFDSSEWKARALDGDIMWPTRLRMIDDLMGRGLLDGATRQEVEQLLGEPDELGFLRAGDIAYELGPERSFIRIDSDWLVIQFGSTGIVEDVVIVPD